MHYLAVGKTSTGKSTLLRRICRAYRSKGRGSLLLEQRTDTDWIREVKPQFRTTEPNKFLEVAKKNYRKCLVVEDAFAQLGQHPGPLAWLGTDARHNGHVSMFGVQKYTGFSTILRENVRYIYAFRAGPKSAQALAEDYCRPEFLELPTLPYGVALYYDDKADTMKKLRIWTP